MPTAADSQAAESTSSTTVICNPIPTVSIVKTRKMILRLGANVSPQERNQLGFTEWEFGEWAWLPSPELCFSINTKINWNQWEQLMKNGTIKGFSRKEIPKSMMTDLPSTDDTPENNNRVKRERKFPKWREDFLLTQDAPIPSYLLDKTDETNTVAFTEQMQQITTELSSQEKTKQPFLISLETHSLFSNCTHFKPNKRIFRLLKVERQKIVCPFLKCHDPIVGEASIGKHILAHIENRRSLKFSGDRILEIQLEEFGMAPHHAFFNQNEANSNTNNNNSNSNNGNNNNLRITESSVNYTSKENDSSKNMNFSENYIANRRTRSSPRVVPQTNEKGKGKAKPKKQAQKRKRKPPTSKARKKQKTAKTTKIKFNSNSYNKLHPPTAAQINNRELWKKYQKTLKVNADGTFDCPAKNCNRKIMQGRGNLYTHYTAVHVNEATSNKGDADEEEEDDDDDDEDEDADENEEEEDEDEGEGDENEDEETHNESDDSSEHNNNNNDNNSADTQVHDLDKLGLPKLENGVAPILAWNAANIANVYRDYCRIGAGGVMLCPVKGCGRWIGSGVGNVRGHISAHVRKNSVDLPTYTSRKRRRGAAKVNHKKQQQQQQRQQQQRSKQRSTSNSNATLNGVNNNEENDDDNNSNSQDEMEDDFDNNDEEEETDEESDSETVSIDGVVIKASAE